MKRLLRTLLEQRAPTIFNGIRAIRHRRMFRQQFSQLHATMRELLFPRQAPITVQTGPFRGVRYLDVIVWGPITTKWLGSYEAELHGVIDCIKHKGYDTIIDVGCAEGYYAVGLAVIVPDARILAFDTDFISRRQVRRMAELNGVADRLQVGTYCNHADLDQLSTGRTLVVCDIEGFEVQLLDPNLAPSLLHDDILVEVHEPLHGPPQVEQLLRSRFAATHRIECFSATNREAWIEGHRNYFPQGMSVDTIREATNERRAGAIVWLWMQANPS